MINAQILSAEIDDKNRSILTKTPIADNKEVWGVIDYRTATLMSICDEMSYNIQQAEQPIQLNAVVIIIDMN